MTGEATAGSGRAFRLDPCTLPVRGLAVAGNQSKFYLDRERVVVQRRSATGPRDVIVPVSDYEGVSVRIEPKSSPVRLMVELAHINPDLNLTLAVGEPPDGVAEDWERWGRELDLPLIVMMPDGSVTRHCAQRKRTALGPVKQRRRHASFTARRPRFLTRRKVGAQPRAELIDVREIIART